MTAARKLLTTSEFDEMRSTLEARLHDWHQRECTSFDDAVRAGAAAASGGGSGNLTIWDEMPAIDSKKAVSALVEIEQATEMQFPVGLIKSGGYDTLQELLDDLFPKVRAKCYDPAPSNMVPPPLSKHPRSRSLQVRA